MPSETTPARAPKGLKIAGIVAAVVAVGIIGTGAMTRSHDDAEAQQWADARSIPTVHLISVTASASSSTLTLPGTTEAWNSAKLYARVGGYLKAWYLDIGARVATNAPLGQIDTPELDQQIAQARADLASARAHAALAKSTAARWGDLLKTNSVSRQEADEKNGDFASKSAAVESAQANLARLQAQKSFGTLRAPFGGIVTTRSADIGDLVGPGATTQQPLFAIADVHKIRVYVNVPQTYSASMRAGLMATLTVPDYPNRTFEARVIGNAGMINTQTGTFQVQLVADNADGSLKPGGYAQVRFDVPGQGGTVQVPASTLLFRAQGTQVASVALDGHVKLQPVVLGRDLGGTVEVTSGLVPGARIVDNPPDSLSAGELVRVADASHV